MSIKEYFSKAENVVKAQLLLNEKYDNDCVSNFFYGPIEIEAFGGEIIYVDDGPPNSGEPFITEIEEIDCLAVPKIENCEGLQKVLKTTRLLKEKVGDETPIIGVVMSPFSLPVMQMGFEKYIEIIYEHPEYFEKLMSINEDFCAVWANAQLEAGATAICYFDPLASPNIIDRVTYIKTGHLVAKRTISRINGPTATHLASGIALPVIEDLAETGTAIVGFSTDDDLCAIKKAVTNKLCLLGNLNGLEMIHWDMDRVEREVRDIIIKAGIGGGLILSDNHGEVPWQMPEEILLKIVQTVRKYGTYPIMDVVENE